MAKSSAGSVTVTTFGGLRTDCSPTQVPQGESPSCQDVSFAPGAVFTREALMRMLTTPSPYPLVWGQGMTAADGSQYVLVLDSQGTFSKVVAGALVTIGTTVAGAQVSAMSVDGRMYMALSDGSHGVDVPRQYDPLKGFFDRVSQGGPAQGPTVTNLALPPVQAAPGSGISYGVANIITSGYIPQRNQDYGGYGEGSGYITPAYYSTLTITFTAAASLTPGTSIEISGNSNAALNGYASVLSVLSPTQITASNYSSTSESGTGGTAAVTSGNTLTRSGNTVTATSATSHSLQVGYRAQMAGFGVSAVGGSITSIVVDNETNNGIATITTSQPHGLKPQNYVTINGVTNTGVGGGVTASAGYGSTILVTTSAAHGLSVGSTVTITGLGDAPHYGDGTWTIQSVPSATEFMYEIPGANLSGETGGAAGTVALVWPIQSADPSENIFQVTSCPSPNVFQVSLNYPDGTWTSGTISFAWDGTFYVTAVLSPTSFQYQQIGPDAATATVATITPQGQLAPGIHLVQVMFLTRTDFLTAPSPPVQFVADGSGYASVSNLPIGPPNTIARYVAFTGANGGKYFVLEVPAQNNGLPISTSTVVNDNATTSIVFDFSDQSLLSATGIDIPGNNLAAQVTLEPCLGVASFADRTVWWGGRNAAQNLLNMGFEGGVLAGATNLPLGWTVQDTTGTLVPGDFGLGWQVTGPGDGFINQGAYQDYYGAAIVQPETLYSFRFWGESNATAGTITAELYGGGAVLATATVGAALAKAGFYEATFSAAMPAVIPSDTVLQVFVSGLPAGETVVLDELTLGYAQNPYRNPVARVSYVDNPEAFDGVTGLLGPADDSTALMGVAAFSESTALMVTQRAAYVVMQSGDAEPANWTPRRLADNCGMSAVNALTVGTGWAIWGSGDAAWLYSPMSPVPARISSGIQPSWQNYTVQWAANDPTHQRVYFGGTIPQPTGTPPLQQVWLYDYHQGIEGGKWTPWSVQAVFASQLAAGMCFFASANAYTLDMTLTQEADEDFGTINATYVPAAFADSGFRKIFTYLIPRAIGDGYLNTQLYRDELGMAVKSCRQLQLSNAPESDVELSVNLSARYLFTRFTQNGRFRLEAVTVLFAGDPMAPVSGRN